MNEWWIKRTLTDQEQQLRNQHRCICCGVKVKPRIFKERTIYEFECPDCYRTRTGLSFPTDGYGYGPARASVQHAALAATGYTTFDGGRLDRTTIRDDDEEDHKPPKKMVIKRKD